MLQAGNTGVAFVGIGVGSFTDGNPGRARPATSPASSIGVTARPTASPSSPTPGPGRSTSPADHTYAKPGVYMSRPTSSTTTARRRPLTATFTITDLPVTGAVNNFSGVEGQDTGTIVLATCDGSQHAGHRRQRTCDPAHRRLGRRHAGAVVTLTVSQIGVDAATGDPIFRVLGSHKYAEEGTFTVNINVTTSGGVTTALTPGTATIVDAKLTGTSGNEITGIEGSTHRHRLARDLHRRQPGGDHRRLHHRRAARSWSTGATARRPKPLTAGNLTAVGSPNGVIFDDHRRAHLSPRKEPTPTRSR